MQNYTAATIEGHVTHEPTLRSTKTGKSVCTFSIAVNHYSQPDSPPRVSYIDVETWEKVADMCGKNVAKGKRIMVIGSLKQDRWEGKDGKTQSKIKLVGTQIRFLDSLPEYARKDAVEGQENVQKEATA
ncbi:MAG TPA: single-stranded DNA-binding protein [Spirochaetes bacterium]|nr:single-stranded DNA-binding protein [Spirochaetota bacterium]